MHVSKERILDPVKRPVIYEPGEMVRIRTEPKSGGFLNGVLKFMVIMILAPFAFLFGGAFILFVLYLVAAILGLTQ